MVGEMKKDVIRGSIRENLPFFSKQLEMNKTIMDFSTSWQSLISLPDNFIFDIYCQERYKKK